MLHILQSIINANLPHATERVAIRLLALSHEHITFLYWDEYLHICNRHNINSARKHLTSLQSAGILHYTTNGHVYILWSSDEEHLDAPPMARTRATHGAHTRHPRRAEHTTSAPDPEPTRHPRRADAPPTARRRATHGALSHTRDLDLEEEEDLSSDHRSSSSNAYTKAQLRNLKTIGISPSHATPSPDLSEQQITQIIADWQEQADRGEAITVGALIYRLRHGWAASTNKPPTLTPEEERKRKYIPPQHAHLINRPLDH